MGFKKVVLFDDIIIGSGLISISTLLGLLRQGSKLKILVVAGPKTDNLKFYNESDKIPNSNFAYGGLGKYWHGVIPLYLSKYFDCLSLHDIEQMLTYFYPKFNWRSDLGKKKIFVPRNPIRPIKYFDKLAATIPNLHFVFQSASSFSRQNNKWKVNTAGNNFFANRLWLCAGTLGTAKLLDDSGFSDYTKKTVSDHFIFYLGQMKREKKNHVPVVSVKHNYHGYIFEPLEVNNNHLVTARPAFFDYKILDKGISQRKNFGLPTSDIIKKLLKCRSLGLLGEAFFNKFGINIKSDTYNIYAQIRIKDAFERVKGGIILQEKKSNFEKQTSELIENLSCKANLLKSQFKENSFPAIHLHDSIDNKLFNSSSLSSKTSSCKILDPSIMEDIGPDHHVFRMMSLAYKTSQQYS